MDITDRQRHEAPPRSAFSLLDTDMYKLTMQCAVLKFFPESETTYQFRNRTPDMLFTREAFEWLRHEINLLGNITLSPEEREYLQAECPYLNPAYIHYLSNLRLYPEKQVDIKFHPTEGGAGKSSQDGSQDWGSIEIEIRGKWVETIPYEILLLALTSEAYFLFCDRDWNHDGQEEKAYEKACALLKGGCAFSEFGSRRRRDYRTQNLVMQGLCRGAREGREKGWDGKFTGTSNVHFAMKYNVKPIGTVAHEWYMGIAAITNNYEDANEIASQYWIGCFGAGNLSIALTDTFGTPNFLKSFNKVIPHYVSAQNGPISGMASGQSSSNGTTASLADARHIPVQAPISEEDKKNPPRLTYAEAFDGVRQDSGDPKEYVRMVRKFYDEVGIKEKKHIVFSDSLNVERCLEYKKISEEHGFIPSFGVGTFLTNDFKNLTTGRKSVPLNIVIKLSSAGGRPAVKLSDNLGKNTGDSPTVAEVKERLGYVSHEWEGGDERRRWG